LGFFFSPPFLRRVYLETDSHSSFSLSFTPKGKKIVTQIEMAGTFYDAEAVRPPSNCLSPFLPHFHVASRLFSPRRSDLSLLASSQYHQLYLDVNPDGYTCPTHKLYW